MIEKRPWGSYEVISDNKTHKVKIIVVNPGERLSLQSHKNRDETWVYVSGAGEIEVGFYKIFFNEETKHVFIARGDKHRVSCLSKEPLIFIEVQTGELFDEDDIIRYEDDYGRV